MKKPFQGYVCRVVPKNHKDTRLRQFGRIMERILVNKINMPENKKLIQKRVLDKMCSFGVFKK
jgi:hypothetical protein